MLRKTLPSDQKLTMRTDTQIESHWSEETMNRGRSRKSMASMKNVKPSTAMLRCGRLAVRSSTS